MKTWINRKILTEIKFKKKAHRRQKWGWASQEEYKDIAPVYWNGVKKVKAQLALKSVTDVTGSKTDYGKNRGHGED